MAVAAAAITGAIALGTSIAQGIKARRARKRAEKLRQQGMLMGIPQELSKNQQLAEEVRNMGGMTRQEYQTSQQGIQRNASAALNALRGRRSAIAGVGRIQQASDDAQARLDAQNAAISRANRLTGTQALMGANAAIAAQRARNIDRDYFGPAAAAETESQALTGAAIQNIGNLAMTAAQFYGMRPQGNKPSAAAADAGQVDVVSKFKIPEYRVKVN